MPVVNKIESEMSRMHECVMFLPMVVFALKRNPGSSCVRVSKTRIFRFNADALYHDLWQVISLASTATEFPQMIFQDFLDMQPSLMDALATALGQKMTFKLYDQWKSFFKLVFEQIFEVRSLPLPLLLPLFYIQKAS